MTRMMRIGTNRKRRAKVEQSLPYEAWIFPHIRVIRGIRGCFSRLLFLRDGERTADYTDNGDRKQPNALRQYRKD